LLLKKIKNTQIFWNLINKISKYIPKRYFLSIPDEIIVEVTNICNLKCPVCPTNFLMKREKGCMELDILKLIIDDFKNIEKKPRINFGFSGEPLINRKLPELIEYAKRKGHFTYLSTNCTLLDHDISLNLIESGLDLIYLAIDGFSPNSHEKYRVGSNFEQIKNNIENFIILRRKLGKHTPKVIIQTLITSYSEKEIPSIINWAKKIGADGIFLKSFSLGSYTNENMKKKYLHFLPKDQKYRRKQSNVYKTICTAPLKQSLVFWNGNLGLCCVDFNNIVKLPNIKTRGFLDTFFSEEVIKIRKAAFMKELSLCKNCSIGNADYYGEKIFFN